MTSEAAIQRRVLDYLARRGVKAIKVTVGQFEVEGTPDVIGCYRGQSVFFELKNETYQPTTKQLWEMIKWLEAGAVGNISHCWEDAAEILLLVDTWLDQTGIYTSPASHSSSHNGRLVRDVLSERWRSKEIKFLRAVITERSQGNRTARM